jgi:hypothetical protein
MDPYLEGSEWMSFHSEFCIEIARQLRPKLRPRYVALPTKRLVTETPDDLAISTSNGPGHIIYSDVSVTQATPQSPVQDRGGVAVLEPPLQIATVMPELIPQLAIEIRDVAERQLVTLIEVLSPANKRGDGYTEYVAKRQRVLLSTAHLLEIDLLRRGRRVPMRQPLPPLPYFVFLSRFEKRPLTEVWPIALDQPLPVVPVPLLPEDDDVALDLQSAFTNVYDSIGYDLLLDYTKPPEIPLDNEAASWLAASLGRSKP